MESGGDGCGVCLNPPEPPPGRDLGPSFSDHRHHLMFHPHATHVDGNTYDLEMTFGNAHWR